MSREGEGPLKLEEIRVALYKKKEYKWVVECDERLIAGNH